MLYLLLQTRRTLLFSSHPLESVQVKVGFGAAMMEKIHGAPGSDTERSVVSQAVADGGNCAGGLLIHRREIDGSTAKAA